MSIHDSDLYLHVEPDALVVLGADGDEIRPHVRIPRCERLPFDVVNRIVETLVRSSRPSRVLLSLGRGVEVCSMLPLLGRLHRLSGDPGFALIRVPDPLATAKAILSLRPLTTPATPVTSRRLVPPAPSNPRL